MGEVQVCEFQVRSRRGVSESGLTDARRWVSLWGILSQIDVGGL